MNRLAIRAFTLIEMLVVMVIIAILTSLVVAVTGLVQKNAAVKRAEGEIAALSIRIDAYKQDNGEVPRTKKTDELDPRMDGNPVTGKSGDKYQDASVDLYSALSGDFLPDGSPDGKPEEGKKAYYEFPPSLLKGKKDANGKVMEIKYIQDPFGNSYGYSTARYKAEADFQKDLRKNAKTARPTSMPGYNPTFDLWSTGGSARTTVKDGEVEDVKKWVKNW